MKSIKKRMLGLATVAALGLGLSLVAAAPAQAACSWSSGMWSAKDISCSSIRHISYGSSTHYAPWVGRGATSWQSVCWAGATTYGVQVVL